MAFPSTIVDQTSLHMFQLITIKFIIFLKHKYLPRPGSNYLICQPPMTLTRQINTQIYAMHILEKYISRTYLAYEAKKYMMSETFLFFPIFPISFTFLKKMK